MGIFDVHGVRPRIKFEMPDNGLAIGVQWNDVDESTFYFDGDISGWWRFRTSMPKASDYWYSPGQEAENIRDHDRADVLAAAHYQKHRVKETT
jgi:hypothetical protein